MQLHLLIIGINGTGFAPLQPLSIIHMRNWNWSNRYWVPGGISIWVKVGLGLTVVVVGGAIVAGLVIRWRRNKRVAANIEAGLMPDGQQQRKRRSKLSEKDGSIELRSVSSSSRRTRRQSGSAGSESASASSGSRSPRPRRERKRRGSRPGPRPVSSLSRDREIDGAQQQRRQQDREERMIPELEEVEGHEIQDYPWHGQASKEDLSDPAVEGERGSLSPSSTLVPKTER